MASESLAWGPYSSRSPSHQEVAPPFESKAPRGATPVKVSFEITPKEIEFLLMEMVRAKLGPGAKIKQEDLKILVRSKQNYRIHEWEKGELCVKFEGDV